MGIPALRSASVLFVKNPGISYPEFLFLIPGSRAITSWSFYAIHITKTRTLLYDITMTSWVQTIEIARTSIAQGQEGSAILVETY